MQWSQKCFSSHLTICQITTEFLAWQLDTDVWHVISLFTKYFSSSYHWQFVSWWYAFRLTIEHPCLTCQTVWEVFVNTKSHYCESHSPFNTTNTMAILSWSEIKQWITIWIYGKLTTVNLFVYRGPLFPWIKKCPIELNWIVRYKV